MSLESDDHLRADETDPDACPHCEGTGREPAPLAHGPYAPSFTRNACGFCGATGQRRDEDNGPLSEGPEYGDDERGIL